MAVLAAPEPEARDSLRADPGAAPEVLRHQGRVAGLFRAEPAEIRRPVAHRQLAVSRQPEARREVAAPWQVEARELAEASW
jgi:hypothetical protein